MQTPSDPDSLVRQAAQLSKAGQRAEARQCLLTALQIDPRHSGALWGLANVTGSVDERRAALINLLNIQPGHTQAGDMLAQLNIEHPPQIGFEPPAVAPVSAPPQPPMFVEAPEPPRRAAQPPRARKPQGKRSTSPLTLVLWAAMAGLIVVVGIAITLMMGGGPDSDDGGGLLGLGGDSDARTCRVLPSEMTSFADARYDSGTVLYSPESRVQAELLFDNGPDAPDLPLIIMRNMDTGEEISRTQSQGDFRCDSGNCHLSQDGQYVVLASMEYDRDSQFGTASVTAYETRSGALMYQYNTTNDVGSISIVFGRNNDQLVLYRDNSSLNFDVDAVDVMDTRSGAIIARLIPPPEVTDLSSGPMFSPDGSTVLLREWWLPIDSGEAVVFALPSGEILRRFPQDVTAAAYSPDGSLLATGHRGHILRIYDAATGEERAVLEDPLIDRVLATGVVNREELQDEVIDELVFSPDGRMLAVGTGMQLFYLWEWETGEQHPLFTGYDSHGIVFLNSRTLYYSYSAESTGIVECTNFSQPSPMQIQQEALAGRWNAEPMGTPASLYWLEFTEDSAFRYDGSSTIDTYAYFWWENFLITVRPNGISAAEVLRLESNRFELGAIYEPDILDRMP